MKLIFRKTSPRVLAAACFAVSLGAASCSAAPPSRLAQNADNGTDGITNFREEFKEMALATANTDTPVALAAYDFRDADLIAKISGAHSIEAPRATKDGALITISGDDPYFSLSAVDLPRGVPLWAHLRIKATQSGNIELFYWNRAQDGTTPDGGAAPERAASGYVTDQGWQNVMIPLPAMGPGTRFRIDPPGGAGSPPVTIASLSFTTRVNIATPQWPALAKLNIAQSTPLQLRSGALTFRHDGKSSGGFSVSIDGKLFARGLMPSLIGYATPRGAQWLNLANASTRVTRKKRGDSFAIIETTTARDKGGATWILTREYSPSKRLGGFEVTARVRVSQKRSVVFLPLLMVLPGAGSFGAAKNQALFSGLEYLGKNELSSSDLDITTSERFRRVPLSYKISMPLMSVQNDGNFLALSWQPQPNTAAFFDSPDRTFKGGGHAMGLIMPGAEKIMREDGNPLPYSGALLEANREYSQRATIFGGNGNNIVSALREYVARTPLPPLPDAGTERDYVELATHGWLDSKIREGALVRHAFWPGFGPTAPADAVVYMKWLAARTKDKAQAARLRESASALTAQLNLNGTIYSSVSHVTPPFQPLVLGRVAENARVAATAARNGLNEFSAEGFRYAPPEGGTDYARGNGGSRFANGWTAGRVYSVLQSAAFSGDRELIAEALDKLRGLDKYDNDVPRGAQAWELSLHTPDILASAHLVHAYALGFELTGDTKMLERARYWAWTGVPFVYLTPPTSGKVGLYSTLAVYGASGWVGSWFGRPVQWNGLVYADALRHLARYDKTNPWKKLADGITASGIQQTWPASDQERQGLLPDFYLLTPQVSDGPAINPGTVQSNAAPLYTGVPMYEFRALRGAGFFVHAPGAIEVESQNVRGATFTVRGWPSETYYALISGLARGGAAPKVTINDAPFLTTPENYLADEGRLILPLNGTSKISVAKP